MKKSSSFLKDVKQNERWPYNLSIKTLRSPSFTHTNSILNSNSQSFLNSAVPNSPSMMNTTKDKINLTSPLRGNAIFEKLH